MARVVEVHDELKLVCYGGHQPLDLQNPIRVKTGHFAARGQLQSERLQVVASAFNVTLTAHTSVTP